MNDPSNFWGQPPGQQPQPGAAPNNPQPFGAAPGMGGQPGQQPPQQGFAPTQPTQQPPQQGFGQPSVDMNALGDMIGGAVPSKGGVYLVPGMYPLLQIKACKVQISRKSGATLFITELQILQTQVAERPKGLDVSWTANLTHHQPAPGNVRMFIACAKGVPLEQVGKDDFVQVSGPQNSLGGRLIGVNCNNTKTQRGNDFTVHNWFPVAEEYQQRAMEIRAQCLGQVV